MLINHTQGFVKKVNSYSMYPGIKYCIPCFYPWRLSCLVFILVLFSFSRNVFYWDSKAPEINHRPSALWEGLEYCYPHYGDLDVVRGLYAFKLFSTYTKSIRKLWLQFKQIAQGHMMSKKPGQEFHPGTQLCCRKA